MAGLTGSCILVSLLASQAAPASATPVSTYRNRDWPGWDRRSCPDNEEQSWSSYEKACRGPMAIRRGDCACEQGLYRRESDWACVKSEDCPQVCPPNQVPYFGVSEDGCNGEVPIHPGDCICKQGLTRRESDRACVAVCDRDLKTCPPNEEQYFGVSETGCNGDVPIHPGDCICKQGLTRRESDGRCVASCETQQTCPQNEVVAFDIPERGCQKDYPVPPGACVCAPGFFRPVDGGDCSKKCVMECSPDEVRSKGQPDPGCKSERPVPPGACICKPGYFRNEQDNSCVQDCPIECPENEVLSTGESEPGCKGTSVVAAGECMCKPGFFRKEDENTCVRHCR